MEVIPIIRKELLPRISGIMTFARAPICEVSDLREGMLAFAGVAFDLSSTGRVGARFGPLRIRETSATLGAFFFWAKGRLVDPATRMEMQVPDDKLWDLGDLNVYPLHWPKTEASLREQMCEIARRGATPVIFGGDHFISHPLTLGYADAVQQRSGGKIGYIQFSSQLDLGEEEPLWGKVWRGATARRILDSGVVDKRNMVWVGVNGYIPKQQLTLAEQLDLKVFTLSDVRREGIQNVTEEALKQAGEGCDAVYVSVDVNCVDGAYMPGVDTPFFRGMRNTQLIEAVDIVGKNPSVALDIVGINPLVEQVGPGEVTHRFGAWLALRFAAQRVMKAS